MKTALISVLFLSPAFALAQGFPVISKCAENMFVSAAPEIRTAGSSYTPKCLRVKAGTSVTIQASSHHPLQGILIDGQDNPIFDDMGGAVTAKTVTFSEPGIYGYYCLAHSDDQGNGMAGAILVEP